MCRMTQQYPEGRFGVVAVERTMSGVVMTVGYEPYLSSDSSAAAMFTERDHVVDVVPGDALDRAGVRASPRSTLGSRRVDSCEAAAVR